MNPACGAEATPCASSRPTCGAAPCRQLPHCGSEFSGVVPRNCVRSLGDRATRVARVGHGRPVRRSAAPHHGRSVRRPAPAAPPPVAGLIRFAVFLLLIFVAVWAGVRVAHAGDDAAIYSGPPYSGGRRRRSLDHRAGGTVARSTFAPPCTPSATRTTWRPRPSSPDRADASVPRRLMDGRAIERRAARRARARRTNGRSAIERLAARGRSARRSSAAGRSPGPPSPCGILAPRPGRGAAW